MAIIELGGGGEGFQKYMVDGQKQGREFSRDELDRRITLDGDLDIFTDIVLRLRSKGDRYSHYTIAFFEDFISRDILDAIARDFRAFAFDAYSNDEYYLYAEAHLPRIKSYLNRATLATVVRRPHINFAFPKKNLVTGHRLTPFGFEERNLVYIDAFQEHTNNKYGLASPKDFNHARLGFNSQSDVISRHKGDNSKGSPEESHRFRDNLLGEILDNDICSVDAYKALLAKKGEVTLVSRTLHPYYKVKLAGETTAQKRAALKVEVVRARAEPGEPRKDAADIEERLREWGEVRRHEVKLTHTGSKKKYALYQALSRDEKITFLNTLESNYHAKHFFGGVTERSCIEGADGRTPRVVDGDFGGGGDLTLTTNETRNVVLPSAYVPAPSGMTGSDSCVPMVRTRNPPFSAAPAVANCWDSAAGHILRDVRADEAYRSAFESNKTMWRIQSELSAERVLAQVAISHGVPIQLYSISEDEEGNNRIVCGKTAYSISEFLTTELHLDWLTQARQIMTGLHQEQIDGVKLVQLSTPQKELWASFQSWKKTTLSGIQQEKKATVAARRKKGDGVSNDDYVSVPDDLHTAVRPQHGQVRKSLVRVKKDEELKGVGEKDKTARATLLAAHRLHNRDLYRFYLSRLSETGDEEALTELRRQQAKGALPPGANGASALTNESGVATGESQLPTPADPPWERDQLTYEVNDAGDVTFSRNAETVLVDRATHVEVIKHDETTIVSALRMAVAKFGGSITVLGDEEFQQSAVEVAVKYDLPIDFCNSRLLSYKIHLQEAGKEESSQRHESDDDLDGEQVDESEIPRSGR